MSLDHARITATLAELVADAPSSDWRLVGTASSVVRGIDIPAGDIDVLLRDRSGVDEWAARAARRFEIDHAPAWLPEASQYFARLRLDGVVVELSTVEVPVVADTSECVGEGPWLHYEELDCGGFTVPAVATELRLVTEVARGRAEIIRALIEHVNAHGCDVDLVRRGLADAGIPEAIAAQVVGALAG